MSCFILKHMFFSGCISNHENIKSSKDQAESTSHILPTNTQKVIRKRIQWCTWLMFNLRTNRTPRYFHSGCYFYIQIVYLYTAFYAVIAGEAVSTGCQDTKCNFPTKRTKGLPLTLRWTQCWFEPPAFTSSFNLPQEHLFSFSLQIYFNVLYVIYAYKWC